MPTRADAALKLRGLVAILLMSGGCLAIGQRTGARAAARLQPCRRAVLQGAVHAGQGFQQEFARGLVFGLEPIASGWAVRVVATDKPRGPHDYADVATLPYQSVSPLLLSTDWSFRAQDAVGWTPRRFRYAAGEGAYRALAGSYEAVLRGDGPASARAAALSSAQPEGLLQILDATLAPGVANQVRAAAAVSSHFSETPHFTDGSKPPSPLGRLEELRFRVLLDLAPGMEPARGVQIDKFACAVRPTGGESLASEHVVKR